jgi:hypothetical protein
MIAVACLRRLKTIQTLVFRKAMQAVAPIRAIEMGARRAGQGRDEIDHSERRSEPLTRPSTPHNVLAGATLLRPLLCAVQDADHEDDIT